MKRVRAFIRKLSQINEWMTIVLVWYIVFVWAMKQTCVCIPFNSYFESLHAFNPTEKSIFLYVFPYIIDTTTYISDF